MFTISGTLKRVRSIVLLLFFALSTLPVTATDFITDVMLIGAGNKQDLESLKSKYSSQGWKILDKDFNAGIDWGKGDGILLLYKTATSTDGYNHGFITDLYLQNRSAANTTNTLNFNGRTYNLVPFDGSNHFKDVKGDLNSGTGSSTDAIHLYYTKEHFADNRAITAIFINGNSGGAVGREGNTKSGYNLNAGCSKGENIFLHASTATAPFKDCYFTDIMLIGAGSSSELESVKTTYTSQGWKVIDYDLNKGIDWGKGEAIYLLYKAEISPDGLNHNYITDFYLQNRSAANTTDTLTFRGYTYQIVPYEGSQHFKNVKGDLNSGTGDNSDPIHLYYTRQRDLTNGTTITGIFFNDHSADSVTVWKEGDIIPYDLNSGCSALTSEKIYMHYTFASTWKGLSPIGNLDTFEANGRYIQVYGWAYDPDESSHPVKIKIYLKNTSDGQIQHYDFYTQIWDDDLNASQGIIGAHRFQEFYIVYPKNDSETYEVATYAFDLTGDDSTQLGMKTFTIINSMPKTAIDSFKTQGKGFSIQGWAYDPDFPDKPIDIRIVIKDVAKNNTYKTIYINTDQERNDINNKEGIKGKHGFNTFISLNDAPDGTYEVYIYAIDDMQESGTQACDPQTVTITRTQPAYGLEKLETSDDGLIVQGWAYDPDDSDKSIPIRIEIRNMDGSTYKTWNIESTDIVRDDINNLYNITGTHGFSSIVKMEQSGTYNVSVYACDITGEEDIQMGSTQTVEYILKIYNLWVGDTLVTYLNKDNILNQFINDTIPTAQFDPKTNTLKLNEPTIEGHHNNYKIYTDDMDLTIKGSYHNNDHENLWYCEGIHTGPNNLTLDGYFNIYAVGQVIEAKKIFLLSDTIILNSESYSTCIYCEECHISEEVRYLEITSKDRAIYGKIIAPKHIITTPADAILKYGHIYESDGNTVVKHIVLEPNKESFRVWIGSKQVTYSNHDDILGDGKATFDPETYTLELNNPTISDYNTFGNDHSAIIYSEVDNLTVSGNFIQTDAAAQYCIANGGGNLSIKGDFALSGTLAGVYCDTLNIQNGTTQLTLTGGKKASESNHIVIGDWLDPITPDKKIINGKFYESDGSTLAKQIELTGYETNPYFKLWLGNTQVTQFNKDNILNQIGANGEATAKYDPSSATLTLNNPDISGMYSNSKISAERIPLKIAGSYHMTTADVNYGISAYNPLELSGDFTFLGTYYGINVPNDVTFVSGTLKAVGERRGIHANSFIVKKDVTRVELEGGYSAAELKYTNSFTSMCQGNLGPSMPLNAILIHLPNTSFYYTYQSDGVTIAKKVIIAPGYKQFDLWVGSEQVTGSNCTDIFGDGKVSFNPDNNTLTLNEPVINTYHKTGDNSTATIFADKMNLTIKGKYNMSQANADFGVLVSQGSLTLDGDFTLYGDICGASSSLSYSKRGVYSSGTLNYGTTLTGNIKLVGGEYGLNSSGETKLNGTIYIKGDYTGLFSNNSIYVNEKTLATIEASTNKSIKCFNCPLVVDGGVRGIRINNGVQLGNLIINNGESQKVGIINHPRAYFEPQYSTIMENGVILKKIEIAANYNLFVGGTLVTSMNQDDILDDGGKVRFDDSTNTLIMDSPEIEDYITDAKGIASKIFASDIDLTIKGVYHMKDTTDYGLYIKNGNLTLDGSFTFNGHQVALECPTGTLTIKKGINNVIKLKGGDGYKTLIAVDFVLDKDMIVKEPSNYIFSQTKMTIIDVNKFSASIPIVICHNGNPDDTDSTKVESIRPEATYPEKDIWYDMYGRKLDSIPTEKGLYIYNGKAVYLAQ